MAEKDLSFEECLKELEQVVRKLESKEISLDDAVKYYTDNKQEIMSRYASGEIGSKLYWEIPYGKVEFYATPIYETKVSDLQLEDSDPEPMKTYIENYDKTMHITEEMKTMVL